MQKKGSNHIRGIDVSHHQNTIKWPSVAASGIVFAFIKATEGTVFIDSMLKRNGKEAHAAGIKVGYYHFAHVKGDPIAQAEFMLQAISDLPLDLPLVLDMEQTYGLDKEAITAFCLEFLNHLKLRTGRTPMLYSGASFARTYFGKELKQFPLWVAHYQVETPMSNDVWDKWTVFQYTSTGTVPGIAGSVDLNVMEPNFIPKEKQIPKEAAERLNQLLKSLWVLEDTKLLDIKYHNGQPITKDEIHDLAVIVRDVGGLPQE